MDLLRQHAPGAASRLDAAGARDVAGAADAPVLLLGSVRREGGTLAIEVRAVRPRDGSEVFAPLRESATHPADVPAAIDRLSRAVRSSLGEGEPEVRSSEVRIGNALTQDLEAYRHYFLGLQCAARPVYGQDCGVEFRRAVERDPAFGAAQYQVALWYEGDRVALRRALEYADQRAPAKEQLFIRALAAHVDGKEDDALALYGAITSRWPDEKRAWFEAGDILRHRDRFEAAIPWFERAIELDPDYGWALGHLVEVLGVSGHTNDLRTWTDRWERRGSPAILHALSHAHGWLGDTRAARDSARRAALLGAGLLAMEDLLAAKVYVEEYDDAERDSEILARPESDVRPLGFYALAAIAMYEGRPRAGLARLDALAAAVPGIDRVDRDYHVLRADYLLGMGDAAAVWREVEAERAIDPRLAAEHAAGLAGLGDKSHAAELARERRPVSCQAALFDAVAAYRRGEERKGLEQLRAVAARAPLSVWRLGAIFLYADLAAAAGRDAEAVAAVRTFHRLYMPRLMWRSWAYPRSLVLLARSSERLGRIADACAALDRLAVSWERADPEQPLVSESRALRSRLCHAAR
jgi:tetratricopeptide (TPR) repeat protein